MDTPRLKARTAEVQFQAQILSAERKEAAPDETASRTKSLKIALRLDRRVGHRGFVGADRQRLQSLAEIELAVLLI